MTFIRRLKKMSKIVIIGPDMEKVDFRPQGNFWG